MSKIQHFQFDEDGVCVGESFLTTEVDHPRLKVGKKRADMKGEDFNEFKNRFGKKRAGAGWRKDREASFEQIHADVFRA